MQSIRSSSRLQRDLERLGVTWHARGHVTCSGPSLALARRLDRLFVAWATAWQSVEYSFPPFLSAKDLGKTDYFNSFQHLASFPVSLDSDEASLQKFAQKNAHTERELELGPLRAVEEVLTPAACYHVYAHLQQQSFDEPRYVTTKALCFRRETEYAPLERQWSFNMREIVCVGGAEAVKEFLSTSQARLGRFFEAAGLAVTFEHATDPFFQGPRHPKFFAQKLDPVKFEMVLGGRLAIGSLNFHRNYFGEAFQITHQGEPAFSGCVAFGVERWIYAIVEQYGADPAAWPEILSIAEGAK
jgi:hypothetical protein